MRTGFFSVAAAFLLLQPAASQPHRKHPPSHWPGFKHRLTFCEGHGHQYDKRDIVVVTDIKYATIEAVDVMVYVNEHGEPCSTKTIHHNDGPTTPIPNHPSAPAGEAFYPDQGTNSAEAHPTPPATPPTSEPTPLQEKSASTVETSHSQPAQLPVAPPLPAPPKTPPSSGGAGFSSGVSYSPYNADGTCKSASQVANDFKIVTEFSIIRLYGTDCDQIPNVLAAVKDKGISLFLGIFDLTKIPSECKAIVEAVNGDWSAINTVSVGNELINNGKASVTEVTAAIDQVRAALGPTGYNGPVVTVDTMTAMKANPELCHASDFCAINCHAFFDGNVPAEGAGHFVLDWAQQVSEAAGGKTVVISETGWPTRGDTNNKAVPSKENHDKAIASIKQHIPDNLILFSAFNELWKKDSENTHNAEKFWGILGNAPS